MTHDTDASRRSLVLASAGTVLVAFGAAGCQSPADSDRGLQFTSLAAAEDELSRLAQAGALDSAARWSWAQTLAHCAQSIEYSLSGFPQPKSSLFQHTAGAAAFGVFAWRGRMSHDLAEPIPGAPALEPPPDTAAALARLRASIAAFRQWAGPLRPHFAYGALTRPQYEQAHAMHLANHFSAFRIKA
jgi:hypothetical protein